MEKEAPGTSEWTEGLGQSHKARGNLGHWEQMPVRIPLPDGKLGLPSSVKPSLEGDGNSGNGRSCVLRAPQGPGRGFGLSRRRGTMFPRKWPRLLPTWARGRGTEHSDRVQGLRRPPLCPGSCCQPGQPATPASSSGSQAQGGCDRRRARPACWGQPGPGLNGALCGQQSHLFPPPAPFLSWGHSVAFIPAWPKAPRWEGVSQQGGRAPGH